MENAMQSEQKRELQIDIELEYKDNIAILTISTEKGKPNIINQSFFDAFERRMQELSQVYKNDALKGIVITAKKENAFLAGVDISQMKSLTEPDELRELIEKAQTTFNRIRQLPVPVVAAINGVCLGGGFELALACHYRIAVNDPKISLGLPEISLGIVPAFGGCARLPKLIGLLPAINIICQGKTFIPIKALKAKIIDEVVPEELLIQIAIKAINNWQDKLAERQKFLKKNLMGSLLKKFQRTFLGTFIVKSLAQNQIIKNTHGHYPAPSKALEILVQASSKLVEEIFPLEREAVIELLTQKPPASPAKYLLDIFFMRDELHKSYPGREENPPKYALPEKSAVIGAGKMGGAIAQLLAKNGVRVRLKDIAPEQITAAMQTAEKLTKDLVRKRKLTKAQGTKLLDFINPTLEYTGFKEAKFAIEAVFENINVKRKVFEQLECELPGDAIIATNTSAISIDEIARDLHHPERVIGLHFFSPVHKMPLVEIIPGEKTSKETIEKTFQWAVKLGKIPVLVKNSPAFLVNRILAPYLLETLWLVLEGAEPAFIDRVMTDFGMPVGPCKLADEIGLKVASDVAKYLVNSFPDRLLNSGLASKMLEKDFAGKNQGIGFYKYKGRKKKAVPNRQLRKLTKTLRIALNMSAKPKKFTEAEIVNRLMSVMINEAAFALEEGVVSTHRELDAAMIFGAGFPPFRGGLLHFADSFGTENIVKILDAYKSAPPEYAALYSQLPTEFREQKIRDNGKRFTVANMLRELANENKFFYEPEKTVSAEQAPEIETTQESEQDQETAEMQEEAEEKQTEEVAEKQEQVITQELEEQIAEKQEYEEKIESERKAEISEKTSMSEDKTMAEQADISPEETEPTTESKTETMETTEKSTAEETSEETTAKEEFSEKANEETPEKTDEQTAENITDENTDTKQETDTPPEPETFEQSVASSESEQASESESIFEVEKIADNENTQEKSTVEQTVENVQIEKEPQIEQPQGDALSADDTNKDEQSDDTAQAGEGNSVPE